MILSKNEYVHFSPSITLHSRVRWNNCSMKFLRAGLLFAAFGRAVLARSEYVQDGEFSQAENGTKTYDYIVTGSGPGGGAPPNANLQHPNPYLSHLPRHHRREPRPRRPLRPLDRSRRRRIRRPHHPDPQSDPFPLRELELLRKAQRRPGEREATQPDGVALGKRRPLGRTRSRERRLSWRRQAGGVLPAGGDVGRKCHRERSCDVSAER